MCQPRTSVRYLSSYSCMPLSISDAAATTWTRNSDVLKLPAMMRFTSWTILQMILMLMMSGVSTAMRTLLQGGTTGKWGDVINFPLIPVASANLPNGKVLVWSGATTDDFRNGPEGATFYAIYNPKKNKVSKLKRADLAHDMFCPGIAMLKNGKVMVVGGSKGGDGAGATSIFGKKTPKTGPKLNIERGYNTAVTLANGNVLTLGGSFEGFRNKDKTAEVWSSGTKSWREVVNVQAKSIQTDDPQGPYRSDNYPWLFTWTGGSVFHAGPSTQMNWFTDLSGSGTTTAAGTRGPTAMNGNAVMYQAGKILAVGGAPSYSQGESARTGAELITLGAVGSSPAVETISGPNIPRTFSMSVILPNGEVALLGGAELAKEFKNSNPIKQAEIWNPATKTFRLDSSSSRPRAYHSSAVLVPDGRVFVGGGGYCGVCGVNEPNAEMYSPPYLFNSDGSEASRPTVTVGTTTSSPGSKLTVSASEDLSMVSMIRMGGATHSINTDQRRLELCGPSSTPCGGSNPSVTIPGPGVTIPGFWMVFGVNQAGVPSTAATLRIE